MPLGPWLRALNAVGTVAEAARLFRSTQGPSTDPGRIGGREVSDLERGLANVVVAALKEAFDRDRARFELERDERDAVRAQADSIRRADRLRHVGLQTLNQVRLLVVMSVTLWVASVLAAGLFAPFPVAAKWLLGVGWVSLALAVAAASTAHRQLTGWLAQEPGGPVGDDATSLPSSQAQRLLPWLVFGGFAMTAASVLVAV